MLKENFKTRIKIVYFAALLVSVLIATRLFFIQIVKGDYYESLSGKQRALSLPDDFKRGTIYFTEKNGNLISAATIKKGYQIIINPKILKDREDAYLKLSSIISVEKKKFMDKAVKTNDSYEIISRYVDDAVASKISNLKITGLDAYPESWRYYPLGRMASHLLGFVGYKDDKLSGRYGLELSYNKLLNRDDGKTLGSSNSFVELFFDLKKIVAGEITNGDLILTIEPTVQTTLEKKLEEIKEKYKTQIAGGIIISPKTGEIIAMAGKPDFDPNQYAQTKDFSVFMNPSIESVFEVGSIMKPLTLAAAMDNGSISADTEYFDKGYLDFGSARVKNHDGKIRGIVNMQQVLADSLNTGAIFAMQKMGKSKFREYMLGYGFGEKSGLGLPNEAANKINNIINNNRDIEFATASFGQGIALTPISMAKSLSVLANGGVLMKPYIVKEEVVKGLKNKFQRPEEIRRVLKKETADEISKMLVAVVDNNLVGGVHKMEHYSIAAKTGTAQLIGGDGKYAEDESVHTFFGYAPAFDAKFLVLLFIVKPQGVKYAANTLTEPFMSITNFLLNYYEVVPDR